MRVWSASTLTHSLSIWQSLKTKIVGRGECGSTSRVSSLGESPRFDKVLKWSMFGKKASQSWSCKQDSGRSRLRRMKLKSSRNGRSIKNVNRTVFQEARPCHLCQLMPLEDRNKMEAYPWSMRTVNTTSKRANSTTSTRMNRKKYTNLSRNFLTTKRRELKSNSICLRKRNALTLLNSNVSETKSNRSTAVSTEARHSPFWTIDTWSSQSLERADSPKCTRHSTLTTAVKSPVKSITLTTAGMTKWKTTTSNMH